MSSESKEVIKEKLESLTEEEMIVAFETHVNIEFTIKQNKFIFRNVKESFLQGFSRAKFIKVLTLETEWFNYRAFDGIEILGEKFLITESTKNKVVLVQGNY